MTNVNDNINRRTVLAVGASTIAGLTVGATSGVAATRVLSDNEEGAVGKATVPFFGAHQSGIQTPIQAVGTFVAFTLRDDIAPESVGRLLRLWTTDIALLMSGKAAMADSNAELSTTAARLTVTVGIGYRAFELAGVGQLWPIPVRDLPPYSIDALDPQWSGGDLLLQICADDAMSVAHAVRELSKDAAPFADVAWIQKGFAPHAGVNPGVTPRNLMGQVDGTDNPMPETFDFESTVWDTGDLHPWMKGGSTFVLRRIRMNLNTWEKLKPADQEKVIGRNRLNGAPLTGQQEHDMPDYFAKKDGELVIPEDAHIRRASLPRNIFRRVFNYEDNLLADGSHDVGLLFGTYQAEVGQYMEIQNNLAKLDSLNKWTTPVGSALFAIPPGCERGGWIGEGAFG
jgi:dye decolorizing peroxidase